MKSALLFVAIIAAFGSSPVHADIYGYIDAAGVTHLATEKLDDLYTLFLKTGQADAAPDAKDGAASNGALMRTRLFKRLVGHPNVGKYEPLIRASAARHGLDPQLVKAMVAVESGFEPRAVSDKGAVGLMQVLPSTGQRYGVRADLRRSIDQKLTDPVLNLEIGTRYLSDLRKMFAARPELALAAYNAGENAVVRYRNAIPPFPETQAYIKLVDQFHAFYNPDRATITGGGKQRIRATIPARRNLPDPDTPLRLPAPEPATANPEASIAVPAGSSDTNKLRR